MKFAYSLLLGEYVMAPGVLHSETAAFQIVCPCCKDPVVKVQRPNGEEQSHYFRHHAAVPGVTDCEMRVSQISADVRAATDALGRGQSLALFLSVIRDLLELDRGETGPWSYTMQRYGVQKFAELLEKRFADRTDFDDRHADQLVDRVAEIGDFEELGRTSGLGLSFRRRLAKDILAHLHAPHAGRSRRAAMQIVSTQAILALVRNGEDMSARAVAARRFYEDDEKTLKAWLGGIRDLKTEYKGVMDLTELCHGLLVMKLLTIPVKRILENSRSGRHPLFEVQSLEDLNSVTDISAVSEEPLSSPAR